MRKHIQFVKQQPSAFEALAKIMGIWIMCIGLCAISWYLYVAITITIGG